ncbi:MAG TPA: EAL domain-containing protein [Mycobacteriales bacterium]|jgi:diguanylate cyclase (GGDEF)-like protein/PAS domain S-box-containing protein|nr:EAL domain-containing protein [Mycobacteriales bacterium]
MSDNVLHGRRAESRTAPALWQPIVRLTVLPLLTVTTAATLVFVGGLWWRLLPPGDFAVVPLTLTAAAAWLAAYLLVIRARSEADPALYWVALGVGLSGLALTEMLGLVAFASSTGSPGATGQGSALLYLGFHVTTAAGVLAAALRVRRDLLLPAATGLAVLLMLAALPAALARESLLMTPAGDFTLVGTVLRAVLGVLTAGVAVLWIRRNGARPSATRAWVLVAIALSTYELFINSVAHRRYSGQWWASVGLREATYGVLVAGLLWVTARQLSAAEQAVVSRLSALDGEVLTWTGATERLVATARLLADATSPDGVAHALALVSSRIRPDSDAAVLADSGDGRLQLLGDPGMFPPKVLAALQEEIDGDEASVGLRAGRAEFASGREKVARLHPRFADLAGSVAVLPLAYGEAKVGVLVVLGRQMTPFTALERELLVTVACLGAQALRRAEAEADQQRAASALARLNAQLADQVQTLVATAPDAIVTARLDGTITAVNTHTTEMFGYQADELVDGPVERLLPDRLRTTHAMHRAHYARQPTLRPMGRGRELNARRRDGAEFPVEVSLAPMRSGEEILVLATVRDVSEMRRTEARLHEAVQRFTAAFVDAPVGMALVQLDGRFVQVNQALARMLGYRVDELVGTALTALTDPRDSADDAPQFDQLVTGALRSYARELRLLDADGQPKWVQLSTSLVRTDGVDHAYLIMHIQDLSDRKHYEGQLQYFADHDPLTGLFNRRRLGEELHRHLAEHARYGGAGAVLMLDLDHFKYVNDTLGHSAGDTLIRRVAGVLRHRLRDSDVIARFGGDEFVVLLPTVDVAQARRVAAALLEGIRLDGVRADRDGIAYTTASVGIMPLTGDVTRSAEDVLAAADLAMYAAKEQGRDRVEVFDPAGEHLARAQARFRWLDRVRDALEHDKFVLVAQPILDLAANQVSHVEMLLRMREGNRLLPPGLFLNIAERHGLAPSIDRWVIHETFRIARTLPATSPKLELNLSAESLADPDLPHFVAREIADSGIDAKRLVFEVTETAAITNMDLARRFVDRITALGCAFALDDFGAGYGSFYYLKYLPFDYLKIDGEFIRNLAADRADQLIVTSMVSAAHGLGKSTIAEYVEDEETVELLRHLGVDYAQGYHIGRPGQLPARPVFVPGQRPGGGVAVDPAT